MADAFLKSKSAKVFFLINVENYIRKNFKNPNPETRRESGKNKTIMKKKLFRFCTIRLAEWPATLQ
jgi:hypothetical protein